MKKTIILFLRGVLFTLVSCSKNTVVENYIEDDDTDLMTLIFNVWEDGGTEDIVMYSD